MNDHLINGQMVCEYHLMNVLCTGLNEATYSSAGTSKNIRSIWNIIAPKSRKLHLSSLSSTSSAVTWVFQMLRELLAISKLEQWGVRLTLVKNRGSCQRSSADWTTTACSRVRTVSARVLAALYIHSADWRCRVKLVVIAKSLLIAYLILSLLPRNGSPLPILAFVSSFKALTNRASLRARDFNVDTMTWALFLSFFCFFSSRCTNTFEPMRVLSEAPSLPIQTLMRNSEYISFVTSSYLVVFE